MSRTKHSATQCLLNEENIMFLGRMKKKKKRSRLLKFLKEAKLLQFSEKLHFVSTKGLKKDFLESASKKVTQRIPFYSDASEFFPETQMEFQPDFFNEIVSEVCQEPELEPEKKTTLPNVFQKED
jgi:hypothetical protein